MKSVGNTVSNARYEQRAGEIGVVKPAAGSSKEQKGQYIVAKYVEQMFRGSPALSVTQGSWRNHSSGITHVTRSIVRA